ncbi:MAG: response regulator [Alphaproteobacteria bacterium]|nr:MAG: response regulator [Alphaproteobacteria bacterium]
MQQKLENISVLLVEDNMVDVMGIQRAFGQAKLNNRIVVASDGREALEKMRDGKSIARPYMVLLDLNMPRMNGIEFLKEVRRDPVLRSTVVFVLTTSAASEDKSKAYDQNVAGYIVKGKAEGSFINTAELFDYYTKVVDLP